jgi:phage terminase large subunit-like protein
MIEAARVRADEAGAMERVVVAVDPPAGVGGAACGIVAAGLRAGVVYVLRDASARGLRPLEWAERAVATARAVGAGVIVAEANQGGEMVRQMLEMAGARETCRVALRHAKAGKVDRAQPVSGRYERGEIRHVGVLRELEDEMCAFGAEGEMRSPDRVDAMVWAVLELTAKPAVKPAAWMA